MPPLINAYMNLSPSMRSFGTCPNHHLAGTTDTGILITLGDIYADKRARHMESYTEKNPTFDRRRFFGVDMKRLPWWRKGSEEEERQSLQELARLKLSNTLFGAKKRKRRRKKDKEQ